MTVTPEQRQALERVVLEIVTSDGPIKASNILNKLPRGIRGAVERSDVNSVLYAELKGKVVKDETSHAWSRVEAQTEIPVRPPSTSERPREVGPAQVIVPTPEQQKAIEFAPDGHLLVRGEAGSGKTTVLAARAGHIAARFGSGSLLFVTYNTALAAYVRILLDKHGVGGGVEVLNFHQWARAFAGQHGYTIENWVTQRDRESRLPASLDSVRESLGEHRLLAAAPAWWGDEIGWIYGRGIAAVDDYAGTVRSGRGTAVQVRGEDRNVVWAVFEEYQRRLRNERLWDMDDPGGLVFRAVSSNAFRFSAGARRDHVFIDEVQDFDKSWLLAITPIAAVTLTLAGDLAQRIYRRSFTWKEVGINVTGARSKSLRGSFRTTRQIMLVAQHLATNPDIRANEDYLPPSLPDRHGPPVLRFRRHDSRRAETDALAWLSREVKVRPNESWAVGVPFNRKAQDVGDALQRAGVVVNVARGERLGAEQPGCVVVTTYYQLKGLEYDNVVLLSLEDSTMPGWFLKSIPEEDRGEVEPFHRRLIYVAMTRARRQLVLSGAEPFSRFFKDVPSDQVSEQ